MRHQFLAAVAAVRELVVRDASFAVDVWVERLAGVSVYCEEFERLAEEGFDEEGHFCLDLVGYAMVVRKAREVYADFCVVSE